MKKEDLRMMDVRFCPFCSGDDITTVAKQTIKASADSPEPDEVICTYCCADCGGMFTTTDYEDNEGNRVINTKENFEACPDVKCKHEVASAEYWRNEADKCYRELEKVRWLLDLAAKEGMRRE